MLADNFQAYKVLLLEKKKEIMKHLVGANCNQSTKELTGIDFIDGYLF